MRVDPETTYQWLACAVAGLLAIYVAGMIYDQHTARKWSNKWQEEHSFYRPVKEPIAAEKEVPS